MTPPRVTVMTPTHNRAHLIHRVRESLAAQSWRGFEWLVIDDGSTDGTEALIRAWAADPAAPFPIRYVRQPHGHKKTATNRGVREARGEMILEIDSDDGCDPETLAVLIGAWDDAGPDRERLAGVACLCRTEAGAPHGRVPAFEGHLDATEGEWRFRHRAAAETLRLLRRDVMLGHPLPDHVPGHVPASLAYHLYPLPLRFLDRRLGIYYLDGTGPQDKVSRQPARRSAPGYLLWLRTLLGAEIAWFRTAPLWFLGAAARITRYWLHCRAPHRPSPWPEGMGAKALVALTAPVGLLWWGTDRLRGR